MKDTMADTASTAKRALTKSPRRRGAKRVNILGIRGLPAAHGGFETFAAHLAPYLRDRGWDVNVYCQLEPDANGHLIDDFEDDWEGIHRIHLGSRRKGSLGSIVFDWRCTWDVQHRSGIDLVLGYNTAVFTVLQRLRGRKVAMNMDGVEWKRAKWPMSVKAWFYLNEFIGANSCSVPIADHPEIARHLKRHFCHRAVVIPYGADRIENASASLLGALGLSARAYMVSIARIEPENSILELVEGFSSRQRGLRLVVLGRFADDNPYHQRVRAAASHEVLFPGAIYDHEVVSSLRFHSLAYLHGHQVGGTNPSLVESLGAGCAVIAHDNRFNRWVAGPDQYYFSDKVSLEIALSEVIEAGEGLSRVREAALRRHKDSFSWDKILRDYESLLRSLSKA